MALTFGQFLSIFTTNDASGGRAIKATFDTGVDDAANYLTKNDPAGGRAIKVVNVGAPLGPQFWTEAYTATTQATSSWTPAGAAANINAAIIPKGTGAITAQIPDGTATGGNARGTYAVDLQRTRTNAIETAGATYSFIGGGANNRALGNYSIIVGGTSNQIFDSNNPTSVSGPYNTAIVGGNNNRINATSYPNRSAYAFIGAGNGNYIWDTEAAFIGAGTNNLIQYCTNAVIGGGNGNTITTSAGVSYHVIGGGQGNTCNAAGAANFIGGGQSNTASGGYSSIVGGQTNTASGSHSSVIGGQGNTVSGTRGSVGGNGSTNSGSECFVFGISCSSNGEATVAMGRNCTANGIGQRGMVSMGNNCSATTEGGVAIGSSCGSTNFYAVALGNSGASGDSSFAAGRSQASGANSFAVGRETVSNLHGQFSHSSGRFSANGDAQAHELVWRAAVTGTAQTELFLDGASAAAILPGTNAIWQGVIDIAAVCTATGDGTTIVGHVEATSYKVTIKRIGTTTSLVGTVQEIGTTNADGSMATAVITIDNNDTNESLRIRFTPPGTAGSTTVIRVVATFRGLQIQY